MSFSSSTISIGDSTKKADYDRLMANTVALKNEAIILSGEKTFQSSVTFNSEILVSGEIVGIGRGAWSHSGIALSISEMNLPALAALDSTHVAFIDTTIEELRTYVWSGSAWSLEGIALSITGTGYPALTALDSTHVAFIDSTLDSLRTYVWSGSAWSLEGSALSITGTGTPALAALDSTHVAFIGSGLGNLSTYKQVKYLSI